MVFRPRSCIESSEEGWKLIYSETYYSKKFIGKFKNLCHYVLYIYTDSVFSETLRDTIILNEASRFLFIETLRHKSRKKTNLLFKGRVLHVQ